MLYTEEAVKANIRNRDGQRVFYLGEQERLTPGKGLSERPANQNPAGTAGTS